MPSNDPTALPPPNPADRRPQPRRGIPTAGWVAIGVAMIVGIAAVANAGDDDGDGGNGGGDKLSLTEAACKLLDDGDDAELVYSVMKDLAADHPLTFGENESVAARLAVDAAQRDGCG